MGPDRSQRYEQLPPIPSYDEAVSGGARASYDTPWPQPAGPSSPSDEHREAQALLDEDERDGTSGPTTRASRRLGGYRPPTVETDDEDAFGSDDEAEASSLRRDMQEFDVIDIEAAEAARSRSSIWGKRIGFSLSLPQFRWSWQWRLPRIRIRLGRNGGGGTDADSNEASRRRFPWSSMLSGRMIVLVLARLVAVFLILGFLYLIFMSDFFSGVARRMGNQVYDPGSVRQYVQGSVSGRRIRDNLKHFTSYAHLAGSEGDFALASDVKRLFTAYGLEQVTVDEYQVYLNYPKADGRAVEIVGADDTPIWSARLEEEDPGETAGHQTLAFHGHSKSGDVKGPLIYANYGSREDFKRLYDSGIETKGAIALVRYYGSQGDRALKVKAAELAGFAGCIIYSDPADDGFLKGDTAPSGRFMPADGVQRGSVSLMSWVVGDVLTPGWESKSNMPRLSPSKAAGLVQIPSLPLAWRDAQVLLQHIKGFGQPCPPEWVGGVPEIEQWWSGNLSSPIVRLKNEQDEVERQPIWNVYGKVVGVEQSHKTIIVGNHRDSWSFGATDPHSGTAIMLEIARIFGDLLSKGWRPLRTIEFMSWDGEEYNLIGSTEYVERNEETLRENAVAYINLDTAVTGDDFHASGSPVFRKLLLQVLHRVGDANFNTTLRDLWDRRNGELEGLGAGSDYVAFQDIAGTSSLDLRFEGDKYPYHSSYDNFDWMSRVGDPNFSHHVALGQVLGLLILELADRPIIPFDMVAYAESVQRWSADLVEWSGNKGANQAGAPATLDLTVLDQAAMELLSAVREFIKWEANWDQTVIASGGWEPGGLSMRRAEYNNRMGRFETLLLDLSEGGGIPNRTQFKHVIFGPQLWSGYDEAYFPAIRDTIEAGDWLLANKTVQKTVELIQRAADSLIE